MLESCHTAPSLWESLQHTTKPVVLYGMGNGADKILSVLEHYHIPCQGVFASDSFVRKKKFHQWDVVTYADLKEKYQNMVVLTSFGSSLPDVIENIKQISSEQELYLPDVPVYGNQLFTQEYFLAHQVQLETVFQLWQDDPSRQLFESLIRYKITGRLSDLLEYTHDRPSIFCELLSFSNQEVFVDAGAYHGDTVEEFISLTHGKYSGIVALEPDLRNFKRLQQATKDFPSVFLHNVGAWNQTETLLFEQRSGRSAALGKEGVPTRMDTIDHLCESFEVTVVKYDVEGAEREALQGTIQTINRCRPRLMISAYHRSEDLFTLPLLLQQIAPNYQFYLRREPCVPAWDISIIAIPQEYQHKN